MKLKILGIGVTSVIRVSAQPPRFIPQPPGRGPPSHGYIAKSSPGSFSSLPKVLLQTISTKDDNIPDKTPEKTAVTKLPYSTYYFDLQFISGGGGVLQSGFQPLDKGWEGHDGAGLGFGDSVRGGQKG